MARISITIPDSDLACIDDFLHDDSSGLCPSSRSEFLRWVALRFIRDMRNSSGFLSV